MIGSLLSHVFQHNNIAHLNTRFRLGGQTFGGICRTVRCSFQYICVQFFFTKFTKQYAGYNLYFRGKHSLSINVMVLVTNGITGIAIYGVFTPSSEHCSSRCSEKRGMTIRNINKIKLIIDINNCTPIHIKSHTQPKHCVLSVAFVQFHCVQNGRYRVAKLLSLNNIFAK